jgi:hypothetical protein
MADRYNRSRIMKTAHREWAATRHRPRRTFDDCLRIAWAVERQRVKGQQRYNPAPEWTPPEVIYTFEAAGKRLRATLAA